MTVKYTKDHEYIRVEGSTGIVGITAYAQEQLGDIVFVELPTVGKALKAGENDLDKLNQITRRAAGQTVSDRTRRRPMIVPMVREG